MSLTLAIAKRELSGYFATLVGYVILAIFLLLTAFGTYQMGNLYDRGQADLQVFFLWHPLVFFLLFPAVSARLWAEERRQGTVELLMTLPITIPQAVLGKFLAAWLFTGVALVLTVPTWITINYLGNPDNGTILTGYVGSFLMAGGFIAVGACISALTKNQVIATVVTMLFCGMMLLAGWPPFLEVLRYALPDAAIETVSSFSFLTHFFSISKGLVEARDLVFFGAVIVLGLFLNTLFLDLKKAD